MKKREKRYPFAKNVRETPTYQKRFLRRAIIYFILFFCLPVAFSLIYYHPRFNLFPITTIRIFVDQSFVDTNPLKSLIRQKIKGNFFTTPLHPILHELLLVDQIKGASIQRVWPHSLYIYIDGYRPIAYWNQDEVITAVGYTFKIPSNMNIKLPVQIEGPASASKNMAEWLTIFHKTLQSLHLDIQKFILSNGLYSIMLTNGIQVILGNHDLSQRLDRLITLYSKVVGHCEDNVKVIDLRYNSGLAIKWKDEKKCAT